MGRKAFFRQGYYKQEKGWTVKPADKVLQIRRNFILLVAVAREIKNPKVIETAKVEFCS